MPRERKSSGMSRATLTSKTRRVLRRLAAAAKCARVLRVGQSSREVFASKYPALRQRVVDTIPSLSPVNAVTWCGIDGIYIPPNLLPPGRARGKRIVRSRERERGSSAAETCAVKGARGRKKGRTRRLDYSRKRDLVCPCLILFL